FVVCFSSGFPPSKSFRNLPRYTSRTGRIVSSLRRVRNRRLRLSRPREVVTRTSDTWSRPYQFPEIFPGSWQVVRDSPPRFFRESRWRTGSFSGHGREALGLVLEGLSRLFGYG